MAKVVKDTREVMNVNEELEKIEKANTKKNSKKTKEVKADKKKNDRSKKKTKNSKKHSKVVTFLKEVKVEVSKIKWPSKKDMIKYSFATICFIVFFALFFYLIDLIIALLKAGV